MIRQISTLSILALFAGCTPVENKPDGPAYDSSQNPELLSPDLYSNSAKSSQDPMVRYGRYALVNTAPEAEQRDLMAQIIDVSIPANMHPTVQDAMQYVVSRSGYTLCPATTEHVNILFTRPLPAAQYKLGPMTLRNTLQVLAGPAWQVKVNEVTRGVCFVLRPGYQIPDAPRPSAPVIPPTLQASPPSASQQAGSTSVTVMSAPAAGAPIIKGSATGSQAALPSAAPQQPSTPAQQLNPGAKDGTPISQKPTTIAQTTPVLGQAKATTISAVAGHANPVPVTQPAPVAAVVSATPKQNWDAQVGSTLRQSVEEWAKRANWQVIWEPEDLDFTIEAALHFTGSFDQAIAQVFPLYDSARRSFVVDGNDEQKLLIVSERKK